MDPPCPGLLIIDLTGHWILFCFLCPSTLSQSPEGACNDNNAPDSVLICSSSELLSLESPHFSTGSFLSPSNCQSRQTSGTPLHRASHSPGARLPTNHLCSANRAGDRPKQPAAGCIWRLHSSKNWPACSQLITPK